MLRHGGGRHAHGADAGARARRFLLADQTTDFVESGVLELFTVKRRAAGEQLVEQDAQRVDVAAGVDVQAAAFGLLGTHVERRADHVTDARGHRLGWSAPG